MWRCLWQTHMQAMLEVLWWLEGETWWWCGLPGRCSMAEELLSAPCLGGLSRSPVLSHLLVQGVERFPQHRADACPWCSPLIQARGCRCGHTVGKGTLGTVGAHTDLMLQCGPKLALGCLKLKCPWFYWSNGSFWSACHSAYRGSVTRNGTSAQEQSSIFLPSQKV